MNKKISIVMAYYNRKKLLINTLDSIARSSIKDLEIIITDDGSRESERIEDLIEIYPSLKIIRVEPNEKTYRNTCSPYNMALAEAQGDIIILQNPECLHVGDVLLYIVENLTDFNFLSISAYALNQSKTEQLEKSISGFKSLPQQPFMNGIGWYNHPIHRKVYYHFCSALTRKNMELLGGFDERYARGIAYEDNEFVERVKRLNIDMKIPTQVSVIHQWHTKKDQMEVFSYKSDIQRNKTIFELLTLREDSIKKENSYAKK